MSGSGGVSCPRCGSTSSGKFCPECGSPLGGGGCGGCGAPLKAGALYCSECGGAVGQPAPKPTGARLPWILSGLALAAFSVVIAMLVQGQSLARTGEMGLTGGIPGQPGGSVTGGASDGAGMPSMEELAAMSPRGAADRLFERAMREHEGGDFERAAFFIDMGLQAYDAVPPDQIDADARFHIGLLGLLMGDSVAARTRSEQILTEDNDHLLGLLLASRAADFAGDSNAAAELRSRVRQIVEEAGGIPDRVEYQSHRVLIERALDEDS